MRDYRIYITDKKTLEQITDELVSSLPDKIYLWHRDEVDANDDYYDFDLSTDLTTLEIHQALTSKFDELQVYKGQDD